MRLDAKTREIIKSEVAIKAALNRAVSTQRCLQCQS